MSKLQQPVYPPLACMPLWANTGLCVHEDFNQHCVACIDILLEISDGLLYLLNQGVVHGDLVGAWASMGWHPVLQSICIHQHDT